MRFNFLKSTLALWIPLLLLAGNAGLADPPAAAIVPYTETLQKSFTILTNPDLSDAVKSEVVDGLFRQTTELCTVNCDIAIEQLRKLNQYARSKEAKDLFAKIPAEVATQLPVTPAQFDKVTGSIEKILKISDSEKVRRQALAAVEILRYVVSIEEKNLFQLSSRNSAIQKQAILALKEDLVIMHKQGRAMVDLAQVLGKINSAKEDKHALAVRLAKNLDDLGLFFLKFAQSLSNLKVLPPEISAGLKGFQDDVKPMAADEVLKVIREEFGKEANEIFIDFDASKPLKSGTVAQTYRTKIKTLFGTREVVIKVQRPGLAKELDWNRKVNKIGIMAAKTQIPEKYAWAAELFASSVNGLEDAFESELDFRIEAGNMKSFRREFAFVPGIRVPKVYDKYTTSRVLTMEVIAGENIERLLEQFGDADSPAESLKLRKKLFSNLVDAFVYQLFTVGKMHADLHPGNILATENGDLGLIDWGQSYRSRGMISKPVKLALSLVQGDAEKFAMNIISMGEMPEKKIPEFVKFVKATFAEKGLVFHSLKELIRLKNWDRHGNSLKEVGKQVGIESLQQFSFRASPEYLQFFRSAAPVAASLAKIAKGMPRAEIIRILKYKALTFAPTSVVRQLGAKTLHAVDWVTAPVGSCLRRVHALLTGAGP